MTMEVEEAFPSFSTERIRSKMHLRDAPVTQRRLDYNAPLLSVRRLTDAGSDVRSKVWKLSAELSKEPLSVAGAVPFTWEHSPGRPKQPEASPGEVALVPSASKSPPRSPSSPSPPSTPSPPSARRASPASPPLPSPLPLRPLFVRSRSSTLFAPPPPPPPPPPPLPSKHLPPRIARRSAPRTEHPLPSSSYSSPPPPPPLPPPIIQASTSTSHDRVKAFRLFDLTEDLFRALRARREKLEASEAMSEAPGLCNEASNSDATINNTIIEAASATDNSSCGVVDAIVQRFLADHPDASAEEEIFGDGQDGETHQGDDQGIVDATKCDALPCGNGIDDDAIQHCKHLHTDASNDTPWQEDVPAFQVCFNEVADEEVGMQRPTLPPLIHSSSFEEGELEPVATGTPSQPLTEASEVQPEAGDKQVTLIKKQQNKRRMNSIAILDSCRVESFRMIKSAFMQLCRKATAVSLRTLGRAKRKVAPSRRDSSSLEAVLHRKGSATLVSGNGSNCDEKAVVEMSPQEMLSLSEQKSHVEMHSDSPSKSSADMEVEARELREERSAVEDTPISSIICESKETISSPPPCTLSSREGTLALEEIIENTSLSETRPNIASLKYDRQGSLDLHPATTQEGSPEPRPCSVRHVYAKSLGGDEPNEFYDASSRFGSRSSTPSRFHSNRSMSRVWSNLDDFVDATSTPFETPRTSVSESRHSFSASSPSMVCKVVSSNRPTSKLSKRVGKALWVDTRESNATGKADGLCSTPSKNFYSGELFATSNESSSALNKEEPICPRRKCVSGDQASTSTSQARRQYQISSSEKGKSASNAIAVTPVFPSKCQKNRRIASASGLPRQILAEDMQDVGWPLGISGYPPLKTSAKEKAESKLAKKAMKSSGVVPSPPLPPSPAGGSWLRKALSSNQAPSRLAGLHATKKPSSPTTPNSPNNKWEDIVKGSHVQPGHLRFSEELHHHPPNINSTKYYV